MDDFQFHVFFCIFKIKIYSEFYFLFSRWFKFGLIINLQFVIFDSSLKFC